MRTVMAGTELHGPWALGKATLPLLGPWSLGAGDVLLRKRKHRQVS